MKIKAKTIEEFDKQLEQLLCSMDAKNKKGIVYIWKLEKSISRVKGSSPIVYIGQTKNSLQSRYYNTKSLNIEKQYFEKYYKIMIELYGAMSIDIIEVENPKLAEYEELMKYNKSHNEYPPLNRSIPNKPSITK